MCGSDEGFTIACLKPGDEVTIAPGFGTPSTDADRVEVIISVNGFSALTNQATRLTCEDEEGVTPTGNHLNPNEYQVTPAAQSLFDQAQLRLGQAERRPFWFEIEPSWDLN